MPKSCCVPKCDKKHSGKKRSIFMVPKDVDLRKKWEKAIPGNRRLKSFHSVCEKHFKESCIIREYIHEDSNGTVIARVPLKKARLVTSSVPTIFTYKSKIKNEYDKENNSNVTLTTTQRNSNGNINKNKSLTCIDDGTSHQSENGLLNDFDIDHSSDDEIDGCQSKPHGESKLPSKQKIANLESQDHTYGTKMKSSNQVTDINDLRKNISRVKLLNVASPILKPAKKLNSPLKLLDQNKKLASMKKALANYCRTCAEMKINLIDIFSEKGIRMKLYQQIRHLKNIKASDSLSTQICMDCVFNLNMSYTFFMQIKKAENKLKSIQGKLLKAEIANLKKQEEVSTIDPLFIPHVPENLNDNGPRISAVYSVQDPQSWESDPLLNVKMEPQVQEENKIQSDNDSLEEFDPEDPPDNSDSEKKENSDKIEYVPRLFESPERLEETSFMNKESEKREIKSKSLKRKLFEEKNKAVDGLSKVKTIRQKDSKIRRLNVNEALNITKEENGIMYVTFRGKKPNELLLVKVKKMEKTENGKTEGKQEVSKEKEKEQIEEYKKKAVQVQPVLTKEISKKVPGIKKKKSSSREPQRKVKKDEDIITLFQERINSQKVVSESEEEVKVEESEVELFYCDFCFLSFTSKKVIDEHMKIHDKKIFYHCEDCNEKFLTLNLKKNHNMICTKMLICNYCDLILDSKEDKEQHEQNHCDNLFGALCEYCGKQFKLQETLDQHLRATHVTLKDLSQCPKCLKKFFFQTQLRVHFKSYHGQELIDENKRECPVCKKMIPFSSFSRHVKEHKPYTIKCPHCDKMFKHHYRLRLHIRIHEDPQFRILNNNNLEKPVPDDNFWTEF